MAERNSLGMEFVPIPEGTFRMGADDGVWDEAPVHDVTISRPFFMGVTPVTNAQFEAFDPSHKALRGKNGFSTEDDEAVVFVSWEVANQFCSWLSEREGKPYRLPTEAEWEFACGQAPSLEPFLLHPDDGWNPTPVPLTVGRSAPKAHGLFDMHGLVEEWCLDWYGPYLSGPCVDPIGYKDGVAKVTRGGSHNALERYLRTAARAGAMPEDHSWLIGFRVVQAPPPDSAFLEPAKSDEVSQTHFDWLLRTEEPFFAEPIPYVRIPKGSNGPLFSKHNHCPSITWCPNGDLLAAWFSTDEEHNREMTIAHSRLRQGAQQWDEAKLFFKIPSRNMTGTSLFNDGAKLWHFNGVEAAGSWAHLALVARTSEDNGATWTKPLFLNPEHANRRQVISGTIKTHSGRFIQLCDAVPGGDGGTAVWVSDDDGATWRDLGEGKPTPVFEQGNRGAWIAGIHACIVELTNGDLLAFGRGDSIDGRMPQSLSRDGGRTWEYGASPFPPISGGQRLALLRLSEGPILLASFAPSSGLFLTLSFDDGASWSARKLCTDGVRRELDGGAWTSSFTMDKDHAEPAGYLAATQSPDGVIHLVSSRMYYRFNLGFVGFG